MLVALSLFLLLETALRRRLPVAPGTTAIHTKQGLSPIFLPSGLVLASNHMWTKEETDGSVTLGLDAFLSRLFGTPDEVLLPEQDGILEHDTSPIFLRHREKTLRLQVPVAGRVTAVNSRVLDNHALVAKDPYGEGWLREQLDRAIAFFRTRSGAPALATLPDGGVFTEGLLANLGPAVWDEFNKTFATLRKKD
jgi:glycine cleavage system H protein